MTGSTLPERVAQIYYTYGLFCSSYPVAVVSLALSVILLCCYPLLNVPLPGNVPIVVSLPLDLNRAQLFIITDCSANKCNAKDPPAQFELYFNETQKVPYIWAKEKPLLYIQQIIMKIGVSPWTNNLKVNDAFRAPLQEVFRLLETIRNHEDPYTKSTLSQHCYQVEAAEESTPGADRVLPEYGCLLLSPANLWHQNLQTFMLDANIISTIHNYQYATHQRVEQDAQIAHAYFFTIQLPGKFVYQGYKSLQKGKVSIAEMAFGIQLRDTGVKRYPLRARPRQLQFAVTVFYRQADQRFINSLTRKLKEMYPLYQDTQYTYTDEVSLVYYPGQLNYHELIPLLITFVGLFLYVYFSVRKIEFIKSKLGLAACSVLTIAGSLSMSMGICFYFGFTLSLQGKEIFPYLVIIVGLENVLVLTKSVTSTDSRLDVKIRLAQGLSKEGWSITKNLLTEITIFTLSFFTFVPFIQEFSIFMIVSLISDYFIQMVFFATILGVDVRRMELFQEHNTKLHLKEYFSVNNALNWRYNRNYSKDHNFTPQKMKKSKSHPRLNGLAQTSPTDVMAKRNCSPGKQEHRVPKRIKLVNMWARTRFFQRAFMVWMLVWISMIVYNSGIVDYFISNVEKGDSNRDTNKKNADKGVSKHSMYSFENNVNRRLAFPPLVEVTETKSTVAEANDTIQLKHSSHFRPWTRISPYQWSAVLSQYNESLAGRYTAVLPPVLLSHRVAPELAAAARHPDEKEPSLRWHALAAALDPIDTLPEFEIIDSKSPTHVWDKATDLPIYPTTPMEILLLAILCTISVAVIAYMMAVLYRCICSRHYAEWRASWSEDDEYRKMIAKQPAVQLVTEAVPIVVAGHSQEVECLVTDGEKVVSSCLQGNVKVWDSQNGDVITNIDRTAYFNLQKELCTKIQEKKSHPAYEAVEVCCLPERTSQPSEIGQRLRRGLSNHLKGLRFRTVARDNPEQLFVAETTKYDFAKNYRALYCSDQLDYLENNHEAKENVDKNNVHISETNCKNSKNSDETDIYVFSSSVHESVNSLHDINKSNLPNGSITQGGEDSECELLNSDWKGRTISESPVWCMDFCDDLIILGCADGRLEFWDVNSGKLMCVWWNKARPEGEAVGVTHVRAVGGCRGRRVVAATLAGHLTLLRLEAYHVASGAHVDWRFSTAHRRTHKRSGSAGSLHFAHAPDEDSSTKCDFFEPELSDGEEVICGRIAQCRPHQQPITELHSEGGRILTGGQDHVLKVFTSAELILLFTLHGHCGPITSCFIDHATPTIGGSGSQDGLLCAWDLHTGACLYSVQAHDGAVTSLAYTASYVVSAGADERLCIWDRFQGHMLNSIHICIGVPEDDDNFVAQEFAPKPRDYIALSYKERAIAIANAHPKWSLKCLQKHGASRLKHKQNLYRWKEDVKRGVTHFDKWKTIASDTYERFLEAQSSMEQGLNYMSRMLPLTHSLLVMGDRSGLTVYDLSSGDIIRRVLLGQSDGCIFVRQILPLKDAIVCDYANQLRIVRFPLVSRLCDMKNE